MTISTDSLAFFAGALALGLLGSACIITTSEDDGDDVEVTDESGTPPLTTGQPSDSTGPVADETSSGPIDETTGGPAGVCTDNLVLDPGFEAGSPSAAWAEASDVFGSPICDTSWPAKNSRKLRTRSDRNVPACAGVSTGRSSSAGCCCVRARRPTSPIGSWRRIVWCTSRTSTSVRRCNAVTMPASMPTAASPPSTNAVSSGSTSRCGQPTRLRERAVP